MNAFSPLQRLRAFYLATGLSSGIFYPYLSLLLVTNGLNSGQVGLILSIGTLVSIVVQPIWGLVVDRFSVTRVVLFLSAAVPAVFVVFYRMHAPWLIVLASVVSNLFAAPQAPIADAYAVATARRARTSYGAIRLFGSLGFATGGYLGGLYLVHQSMQTLWVPAAFLGLMAAAAAITFPRPPEEVGIGSSMTGGLRVLLSNRRFLVFLCGGLLVSQTLTAFNTYFTLTFRAMGGSLSLTGIAFFIASATNVPAMLMASRVIRRIGRERTMLLAAIAYVLRWGIQAFVPIPSVAIAIQVLHGVSFGFFYVAAVDFVAHAAGKDLQATGQSVFGMVTGGIAGIVGSLVNGYLLQIAGAGVMYGACTASAVAGGACFWYLAKTRKNVRLQLGPDPVL